MSDQYADEELRKARSALHDARTMAAVDVSDEAVVNRLYYACFHAANAVLYARGLEPSTHKGTISLFGEEFVLDGLVSRERGRFLNRLRDYREQADYGHEPISVDLAEYLERSEAFVGEMDRLIE